MRIFRLVPALFYGALAACVGAGILYSNMYGAIVLKSREIGAKVQQLTGTSASEEQFVHLKRALAEHKEDIKRINASFIKSSEVASFIQLIEKFAQNADIDIEISSLTEESPLGKEGVPESFELLRVQFVGSGTWENILNLLIFVESMPSMTRVDQVQFKKVGKEFTKTGAWSGFFSLTAIKEK